jgi:UDP-N-acetylmuramate dehydrogenase
LTHPKIENDVRLAPLTTLGIGGRSRYFARCESEQDAADAVRFAAERNIELFVLGGGSNVLISDDGFAGLTLHIALPGVSVDEQDSGSRVLLTVSAGEDWDRLVEYCVNRGLAGIECLSGIPGFVGGTPIQNVGAYGQEVAETIVFVRCYDRKIDSVVTLDHSECGFAYRTSVFNTIERERYIVLSVTIALTPNGEPRVVYRDLVEHFDGRTPTLGEVRDTVLKIRRSKSMVIDRLDPNSKSAGSFFKNPVVVQSKLDAIQGSNGSVPFFDAMPGMVKIPAAWLIEQAGFTKGSVWGRAGISANHTLALINRGDASAAEIIALKDNIQAAVNDKFGIALEPEPVFVGFEAFD